ncbi:MAG: L-serine ammonia-lyase, iron-sulfur-dependent, subunit alpha [Thermodesulfobacteriota bacterium]|nr:L-serine ammonia-lyase, iron-sulfur-dependent, subunit alpha [Thermodesulfobacteriota bacterium]
MKTLAQTLNKALEVTAGCTEPAAIAFCASFVGKYLDDIPREISLRIDQRTYKNAFGAGIPRAGDLLGSEWALLFGFVMACPEKRLSIFSSLDEEIIATARALHDRDILTVELVETDSLLIAVSASGQTNRAEAIIERGHTRVSKVTLNDKEIDISEAGTTQSVSEDIPFSKEMYDSANWPALIEECFADNTLQTTVRQGIAYNMAAALHGQKYIKGGSSTDSLVMGAIYARMTGDPIPVMSCAGSGNKGLTCMIPVVAHSRDLGLGEEQEIKSVLVSILLTTLITSRFGEVSSVCGAQYAAGAGVIGGLLYLKKELDLFNGAYNNFISAIGGGFCDGAKGSCSMRGNVAVSTALTSITHAENGFLVSSRDGFLGDTFAETLEHLTHYNPLIARFERETIDILRNK